MTQTARKRRRSAHVSTLIVGGAAVLALSGCGGEDSAQTDARIFPTVEACRVEFSETECNTAFETARQLHLQTTPTFTQQQECETAMGQGACQSVVMPQPNGTLGNVFVPALMGFMMAKALQPPQNGGGYIGSGGGYYYPRPIYVDRDGFMRSGRTDIGRYPGGRDSFRTSTGGYSMKTQVNKSGQVGTPTRSTSRGGFGKSSSKFSGGGS